MTAELQNLLERIHQEGIEKTKTEAEQILRNAHDERRRIVAAAKDEAAALLAKAEQDSAAFEQRARQALHQAARDTVISVGEAVQTTLAALVRERVQTALTPEALAHMLGQMVSAYSQAAVSHGTAATRMDVLVSPAQKEEITSFFLASMSEALRAGVVIRGDDSVISGFRVSLSNGQVEHDFSGEAIAESMSQMLRPPITGIIKDAVSKL